MVPASCHHNDNMCDDNVVAMTTLGFQCNVIPNTWPIFVDTTVLFMMIWHIPPQWTFCQNVIWIIISHLSPNWYSIFVAKVKQKYESCFPLIQISRKILKDKPCITKGLKISIKNNHRLYRRSLRENDLLTNTRYKKYKSELRKCLKIAEEKYYNQLFDDTKH